MLKVFVYAETVNAFSESPVKSDVGNGKGKEKGKAWSVAGVATSGGCRGNEDATCAGEHAFDKENCWLQQR